MGVARSGLPGGFLAPAQLASASRFAPRSNGGRGGSGSGLRKEGGGAGESDHPPQAGTKGLGFRAGWRPRLGPGQQVRTEGSDGEIPNVHLAKERPARPRTRWGPTLVDAEASAAEATSGPVLMCPVWRKMGGRVHS